MDKESRLKRAREQGFDTSRVYYHGTREDITEFLPDGGDAEAGALYLTSDRGLAAKYAGGTMYAGSPNIMPLYIKKGFKEAGFPGYLPDAETALFSSAEIDNYIDRVDKWNATLDWNKSAYLEREVAQAKREGYPGVIFREFLDEPSMTLVGGFPSDVVAVIDPTAVRSVNAAFDPEEAGSTDILKEYNPDQPRHPKGHPQGGQWKKLYHVTRTSNVEGIKEKGILPFQTTNWVQAGSGERYGEGQIFAFESEKDAIRWGLKWDWELAQAMGSGEVSIFEFSDAHGDDWETDTADPIGQAGALGKWLKRYRKVSPDAIISVSPITPESIAQINKFDPDQPRAPAGTDKGGQWVATTGGGSGLPMDEESRKKRAQEQGYDTETVYYHGSKQDIHEFKPKYPDGLTFLTTNPDFAGDWIRGTGGLRTRTTGPSGENWAYQEIEALKEIWNEKLKDYPEGDTGRSAWYEDYLKEKAKLVPAGVVDSAVYPVYTRAKKIFDPRKDYPLVENLFRRIHEAHPDQGWDKIVADGLHKEGNWVVYERKDVIDYLKKAKGYDAIWIKESALANEPHETLAVFDPSYIRSVNAAFDPKEKDSTNILKRYDPAQPRYPKGHPEGGRWVATGAGGAAAEKMLADLKKEHPQLEKVQIKPLNTETYSEDTLATKSKSAIYLNMEKFNDREFMANYAKEWKGLIVDPTPAGIVRHEVGHILDGALLDKLGSDKYSKLVDKYMPDGYMHTTAYGMENRWEFMAETYSTYKTGITGFNEGNQKVHKKNLEVAKGLWTEVLRELDK
jgi:hypothetical protein